MSGKPTTAGSADGIDPATVHTLSEFASALQRLRGSRSYAELDKAINPHRGRKGPRLLPPSTLSNILSGNSAPTRQTITRFLTACGLDGDAQAPWTAAWERVTTAHRIEAAPTDEPRARRRLSEPDTALGYSRLLVDVVVRFAPRAAGIHATPADMVSPRKDVGDDAVTDRWRLSSYVRRDHDDELRARLRLAADEGGGLVLLTGRSCTGKTRSAWEAIRAEFPQWQVMRPADAAAVKEIANKGLIDAPTVVWLDDAPRYLTARGIVLTAHDLLKLFHQCAPVVMVGTLWPEEYSRLFGLSDNESHTAEIFRLAGEPIRVHDRVDGRELERARKQAEEDRGLAAALGDPVYGMTQVLAGAPWLVRRWLQPAFAPTTAVITAAIDAYGLGHEAPVATEFLRALAPAYFADQRPVPADWFDRALDEATDMIRGAVAALTPHSDPDDPVRTTGFTVTDYLQDYGSRRRDTTVPPALAWREYARRITDAKVLTEIGYAAHRRGLLVEAETLYRAAITAGSTSSLKVLAGILKRQDRIVDLEHMWRATITAGHHSAYSELVTFLAEQERFDDAIGAAREGVAAGELWPRQQLAGLLVRQGRADEAVQMWRDLAESGDFGGLCQLCFLLADLDCVDEAIQVARDALESGVEGAWHPLTVVLEQQGRHDEASRVIGEGISKGHVRIVPESHGSASLRLLHDRLASEDRTVVEIDEIPGYYERLVQQAESGDSYAEYQIVGLWRRRGEVDKAIARAQRMLSSGDTKVRYMLADMLEQQGQFAEAEELLRDDVAAGKYDSLSRLTEFLRSHGRADEADRLDRYGLRPDGSTAGLRHVRQTDSLTK